jgi:hypothetical protein
VVALALASDLAGKRAADSIMGSVRLVTIEARITAVNNGTTTLIFDRGLVPNGKQITTATQDAQGCRFAGVQFNCGPFSVPPGATFNIALQTTPPLAPSDGPLLLWCPPTAGPIRARSRSPGRRRSRHHRHHRHHRLLHLHRLRRAPAATSARRRRGSPTSRERALDDGLQLPRPVADELLGRAR